MELEEIIKRWQQSAEDDLVTAGDNFQLGHFDWSLYMGQLALEKLLKGLCLKKNKENPPFIHDLNKLAQISGLELTEIQFEDLAEITTYHIKARYEVIKSELYQKATESYSVEWFNKIKEYSVWLKSLY